MQHAKRQALLAERANLTRRLNEIQRDIDRGVNMRRLANLSYCSDVSAMKAAMDTDPTLSRVLEAMCEGSSQLDYAKFDQTLDVAIKFLEKSGVPAPVPDKNRFWPDEYRTAEGIRNAVQAARCFYIDIDWSDDDPFSLERGKDNSGDASLVLRSRLPVQPMLLVAPPFVALVFQEAEDDYTDTAFLLMTCYREPSYPEDVAVEASPCVVTNVGAYRLRDSQEGPGPKNAPAEWSWAWTERYGLASNREIVKELGKSPSMRAEMQEIYTDLLRRSSTAILRCVLSINDLDSFVVERCPKNTKQKAGPKIPRSHQRSQYVMMSRKAVYSKLELGGSDEDFETAGHKKRGHARRGHPRVLRSERYKGRQGQTIWVKSTWVGPVESTQDGRRWVVHPDFGAPNTKAE